MFCGVRRDQVCQVRNQSSPSSLLSLPTPLPHCVWLYVLIKSIYTIILYYCQPKQLLLLWPEILYVRNSPLELLPSSLEHCFESRSNTRLVFVQIPGWTRINSNNFVKPNRVVAYFGFNSCRQRQIGPSLSKLFWVTE